jgi:hypothetical protein
MALDNSIVNSEISVVLITSSLDGSEKLCERFCEYHLDCDEAYAGKGCWKENQNRCSIYKNLLRGNEYGF